MTSETPVPPQQQKEQKVEQVEISKINVPRERVTSVFDAALEEELFESIKSQGILEPLSIMKIGNELWLTDGFHRLEIAERLGMKTVPAIVREGTVEDLAIENICRARQRGRSNPAQEAEMIAFLVERRGWSLEAAAKRMGIGEAWAKKLLAISKLPEKVKDYLKIGKLSVSGAFHLVALQDPVLQESVATDAVNWGYTAEQVKARVLQLLDASFTPEPGGYTFTPEGAPQQVAILCLGCKRELGPGKTYVWLCPDCLALVEEFFANTFTQPTPGSVQAARTANTGPVPGH